MKSPWFLRFIIMVSFFVNTYTEEEIEQNDTASAFTRAISRVSSGGRRNRKLSQIFLCVTDFYFYCIPVWSRMKLCFHVIVASKKKSRARCKWGKWRTSSCSRSCGGGVYTRTRSRVSLRRGTICKGLERVQRRCNRKKCPIKKPSKKYFLNLYIWIEIRNTTIWVHVIRMF